MAWYSKEADKTYIAIGGLIVAVIVLVGLMMLHNADKEKDLLSPEHIMGMIAMPTVILAYAVGHKDGQNSVNGRTKGDIDAKEHRGT